MKYRLDGEGPEIHESCFVSPESAVTGKVSIGEESSVWPFASLRADSDIIEVGKRTNVQDGAVLHTAEGYPTSVGDGVTVGHQAIVHACTVEDNVLVGMDATVLTGAHVGENSIIGAGALVTEGAEIPQGSVVMGVPGKVVREVTRKDVERIENNARVYVEKAKRYMETFERD